MLIFFIFKRDYISNSHYYPLKFQNKNLLGSGNEGSAIGTGGTYERRFCPVGQGFFN